MIRNVWINIAIAVAVVALIAMLMRDPAPVGDTIDAAGRYVVDGRGMIVRVFALVEDALHVVQLLLILAIGGVLLVVLVRNGTVHAPWVAAHVVAPLERWRRRRIDARTNDLALDQHGRPAERLAVDGSAAPNDRSDDDGQ